MARLDSQSGFTIVELLISTAVFSLVLLICVAASIQIGKYFYKGISETRAQNADRQIIDEISNAIEFGGSAPVFYQTGAGPGPVYNVLCIGSLRYTYVTDLQQDSGAPAGDPLNHKIRHVLWRDTLIGACALPAHADLTAVDPGGGGQDLVPAAMRLTRLDVSNLATPLWAISIRIMYGDDEVIDLSATPEPICKSSNFGGDFCGSSQADATILPRLGT